MAHRALKLYWLPFFLIQGVGILLVISYYQIPIVSEFCDKIAVWKAKGGIWTTAWIAAIFWGLLPEAVKAITGRGRPLNLQTLGELIFLSCFFAVNGILVHVFYECQTILFGAEANLPTVVTKVLVDQFFFTPFLAYSLIVILFTWKEKGFLLVPTVKALSIKLYIDRVKPLILVGWIYWFPLTACIYSLPPSLQIPVNICMSAAWALLIVFISEAVADQQLRQEAA